MFDGHDATAEIGDAAGGRFSVEYRRGGRLIAANSVNDARTHMLARRRIAEETNAAAPAEIGAV